ncbi:AfsR/SARP family transcriptional regulator [Streptomyces oceani]|uniref:OmpR/PhoB-type domain-containing protein n=1 Tax=Streptomyces oceani TaxID=1075402 RepID=A0A1E7KG31_9ACTN|nr:BTAD domain-containing putative transcriptional regulator [Streptomyces oceani]OEV02889.1 hypothetical protein AN216_14125 [Streptomyces oceani]
MRYEIVGPLRVVDGDSTTTVSAPKVEMLLAVLLIRSDQIVTNGQLIREIWGEEPPQRDTAGLHVYISQIRKMLKRPGGTPGPVLTRPPGYMLTLESGQLDLHEFERLVKAGRHGISKRDYASATQSLEQALALCRGALLEDTPPGPILQGFQTWLSETRLECMEMLMDSRMELGLHRELISDLYLLSMENPLRETFHRQLMLALHRSDCRGDALRVYQRARRTIHDELGLEPGRALRDMHRAILTADDEDHWTFPASSPVSVTGRDPQLS